MEKHFIKYFRKHQVQEPMMVIKSNLKVVIPVFLEEEYLFKTIESLKRSAEECEVVVELILVFNYAKNADNGIITRQCCLLDEVERLKPSLESSFYRITNLRAYDIPVKHAGVGYARKVGMDYVARSFAENHQINGIIASLDADCIVSPNYCEVIVESFSEKQLNGCTLFFEHPLQGEYDKSVYDAIAEYELHLRYYVQALQYAGFPYAYHTVGSCFAVTANAYVKAGGMPRKQAGEDFYFLQKVIPQGRFMALNNTIIQPSSRPSDRVPFGTGPSITKLVESGCEYLTYNLQAFIDLKQFFEIKDQLYKIHDDQYEEFLHLLSGQMRSYLLHSGFLIALKPINNNCSSLEVFQRRFFEVFNAFRVVKYLNYVHIHFVEKTPVFDASTQLINLMKGEDPNVLETIELLKFYRQIEKGI